MVRYFKIHLAKVHGIKFISLVDLNDIVNNGDNVSVTSGFDNPPKPLYVFRKRRNIQRSNEKRNLHRSKKFQLHLRDQIDSDRRHLEVRDESRTSTKSCKKS